MRGELIMMDKKNKSVLRFLTFNKEGGNLGKVGSAEIALLDIVGLDNDGRLCRAGHCRTGQ